MTLLFFDPKRLLLHRPAKKMPASASMDSQHTHTAHSPSTSRTSSPFPPHPLQSRLPPPTTTTSSQPRACHANNQPDSQPASLSPNEHIIQPARHPASPSASPRTQPAHPAHLPRSTPLPSSGTPLSRTLSRPRTAPPCPSSSRSPTTQSPTRPP